MPLSGPTGTPPRPPELGGFEIFATSGDQTPGLLATTAKLGRASAGLMLRERCLIEKSRPSLRLSSKRIKRLKIRNYYRTVHAPFGVRRRHCQGVRSCTASVRLYASFP